MKKMREEVSWLALGSVPSAGGGGGGGSEASSPVLREPRPGHPWRLRGPFPPPCVPPRQGFCVQGRQGARWPTPL